LGVIALARTFATGRRDQAGSGVPTDVVVEFRQGDGPGFI
jgi:hypothetical protein